MPFLIVGVLVFIRQQRCNQETCNGTCYPPLSVGIDQQAKKQKYQRHKSISERLAAHKLRNPRTDRKRCEKQAKKQYQHNNTPYKKCSKQYCQLLHKRQHYILTLQSKIALHTCYNSVNRRLLHCQDPLYLLKLNKALHHSYL